MDNLVSTRIKVHDKEVVLKDKHNMIKHKCAGCGECCINSKPRLSSYDILILAKKLQISMGEFLQKYVSLVAGDGGFPDAYLITSGACPFLKDSRCSVYDIRPYTCRLFPLGVYQHSSKQYFYINSNNPKHSKTSNKLSIGQFLSENMDPEYEEIQIEWAKFKMILRNTKAPLTDQKFLNTLVRVIYRFDEPDIIKGIEKFVGKINDNNVEFYFQAMEFAERWLLKPFVQPNAPDIVTSVSIGDNFIQP
jgi:Fe-S-cluster containining protein